MSSLFFLYPLRHSVSSTTEGYSYWMKASRKEVARLTSVADVNQDYCELRREGWLQSREQKLWISFFFINWSVVGLVVDVGNRDCSNDLALHHIWRGYSCLMIIALQHWLISGSSAFEWVGAASQTSTDWCEQDNEERKEYYEAKVNVHGQLGNMVLLVLLVVLRGLLEPFPDQLVGIEGQN